MLSEILEHIKSRIASAPIISFPFPHMVIEDFFPSDLYQEMIDNFPNAPHAGNVSEQNFLLPEDDQRLSDMDRGLWTQIRDDIYPEVMDILEDKFQDLIDAYIASLMKSGYFKYKPGYTGCQDGFQLLQRAENFEIAPHVHAPSEHLSILHYLPRDDSHKYMGTQMHPVTKAFDLNIPWNTYPHVPLDCLGEPVIAPYSPNTAVIWVSTEKAIHGRTPTGIERRYIYAYRLFENESVDWSKGSLQVRVEQ